MTLGACSVGCIRLLVSLPIFPAGLLACKDEGRPKRILASYWKKEMLCYAELRTFSPEPAPHRLLRQKRGIRSLKRLYVKKLFILAPFFQVFSYKK
jgi:hypothetical protein